MTFIKEIKMAEKSKKVNLNIKFDKSYKYKIALLSMHYGINITEFIRRVIDFHWNLNDTKLKKMLDKLEDRE